MEVTTLDDPSSPKALTNQPAVSIAYNGQNSTSYGDRYSIHSFSPARRCFRTRKHQRRENDSIATRNWSHQHKINRMPLALDHLYHPIGDENEIPRGDGEPGGRTDKHIPATLQSLLHQRFLTAALLCEGYLRGDLAPEKCLRQIRVDSFLLSSPSFLPHAPGSSTPPALPSLVAVLNDDRLTTGGFLVFFVHTRELLSQKG